MQIGRTKFQSEAGEIEAARAEFTRGNCVVFSDFLEPALALSLVRGLEPAQWIGMRLQSESDHEFANDITVDQISPVVHGLHMLMNNELLFDVVRQVTGCGPIGCFRGRVYRHQPSSEHHLDWHDDVQQNVRLVGLSINLAAAPYEGGIFRIRPKRLEMAATEVTHSRPGSAHIFRIDRAVEHCVTAVTGTVPRTAFAGWFQSTPIKFELLPGVL